MTVEENVPWTPKELELIEKLRDRFKDDMNKTMYEDTYVFYRFLKARDFNLSQAEIMLRKHLQWRKSKKVDTILEDGKIVEVCENYMPINNFAIDKEGAVCYYLPVAKYDVKGVHVSARPSEIDNFVIQSLEKGEKLIKEMNKDKKGLLPGYVIVYDLLDLPFSVATDRKGIEDFIRTAKIIQDNYPERLKCVLIINASNLFTIPFSILKKFIAPNVMKKIYLYGTDGWQDHLMKLVDSENLPAFMGGSKTDPDGNPLCKTTINFAGAVPESYYLKKSKDKSLSKDPGSTRLKLARQTSTEVDVEVVSPGSLIEWEFETKSKDIAFGLFIKEKDGDIEKSTELVPLIRLDCELCSETGVFKCEKPGIYTMFFDNSYSWIRSKELYYKAQVVSPKEHDAQLDD